MKVQILYNRNYIAFSLYIMSIYKYFADKQINVSMIDNISLLSNDTEYLILFLNDINLVYPVKINGPKVIFIHADKFINHSSSDQNMMYTYINNINIENTYVWEYNPINVKSYKTDINWINTKIHYIPLLYNISLENKYTNHVTKIPYENKQNDVLFIGSIGAERRMNLLREINNKYKLHVSQNNQNIYEYMQMIENSKIILNIYSDATNKPFDYYRFAFLYSNRHFLITETPEHMDLEIEPNLANYKEWMTMIDYDNIVNDIDIYLKKSAKEIEEITELAYVNFKKHDMTHYLDDFFQNISK